MMEMYQRERNTTNSRTGQDIVKQSLVEVCDRNLYDLARERAANDHGPLDSRMGTSSKSGHCETCNEPLQLCVGHFGHVKLVLPVLHIGYLRFILHVLQIICKDCSAVLLPESLKRSFLRELRRPNIDNLRRSQICKRVFKEGRKVHTCPRCGHLNGRVKKNGSSPLKMIHERFSQFEGSKALKKEPPAAKVQFDQSFEFVRKTVAEIDRNIKKAVDDLNPLRILHLFEKIESKDCELLGMNPAHGRPEMFIWRYLPVSPICLRPSVPQEGSTTEDDITSKISDIVHINHLIKVGLQKGQPIATIMDQWDFLQVQVAMLVNSESPGVHPPGQYIAMRGFCQRLKGKQGRFRGNLSGKRVDFSGRTVISPDPNLGIDEVAIPELVAKTMTFPEKVSRYNIERLRQAIINGPKKWPGANVLVRGASGFKSMLKFGDPWRHAKNLSIGDVVERHLVDGDVVLFNRQPSLHKLSILAHRVRVRPSRTFRLNECVCTPYNADFDGDEMNVHVPQTEEARAEAIELMGVKHNLATPRNGEPIIAAIQDFITGAYLLSSRDKFYDRKSFVQICSYMLQGQEQIDIPPPAVLKPVMLWTGKQIFNIMLRPNQKCSVRINLDAPCREYRNMPPGVRDLDSRDSWLCIRNSEIMCGVMDKSTIGVGKKESVFFTILRDFGEDAATAAMNRLARLIARYLSGQGFSIGVGDVRPGQELMEEKQVLIERAYVECDGLISKFKQGRLHKASGQDEEQTMEASISRILTQVRKEAGDKCVAALNKHNAAMMMATCGSKGSAINVAQMVAVVGQQIINQERVQEGFQDRTLPHFPKDARQPPSKGFVRNSFYSGLTPSEFFFHAMSGREGLVDTAVKTAETGYMSRRLMKSLEDLSVGYDSTVRNSSGAIIQYQYGDDRLDPTSMEARGAPIKLEHIFVHAATTTFSERDIGLLPEEIRSVTRETLSSHRQKLVRNAMTGERLDYMDNDAMAVDEKESSRRFLLSLESFLDHKAAERDSIRTRFARKGSSRGLEQSFADRTAKLSRKTLDNFLQTCLERYERAVAQPGTAVGAVGAQSIGEPGTQMTLKTFHFAGIANLQITQGVPRIKEIINASKEISTPIITCELATKNEATAARIVKGRIELTFLRDVLLHIDEIFSGNHVLLALRLDQEIIEKLQLDINVAAIVKRIAAFRKLRLSPLEIYAKGNEIEIAISTVAATGKSVKAKEDVELFARMQQLKRLLPGVPICGYAGATRAVIKVDEKNEHCLLVEGYGLRNCIATSGVNGLATKTNSVMEMREVLGIEAARSTIIDEISTVMGDMDIDSRHMQLLADVMTYRGEVLGITRFGLSKMRDSVLQLASFEKTPDHLFEAAWHAKRDKIEGVSECIIMGQSISQGTGAIQVVQPLVMGEAALDRMSTVFEDVWKEVCHT